MPSLPEPVATAIERIRLDHVSGAVSLARQAAETLLLAAPALARQPMGPARATLAEIVGQLVLAQPAMAPLVNLANGVLWHTEKAADSSGLPAAIEEACQGFLALLEASRAGIGRHAEALIPDGACLATHSYSQTVLDALLAARAGGKRLTVICTESRPLLEGGLLARRLGEAGIPVRLIVDAAVYSVLPSATLALVGADSMSSRGLVNKTGTSLLALAAREHAKPFYALCGPEKFLPAGYAPPPESAKPTSEVAAEEVANVTVENFYFETTPLELLTGVVTGDGLLTPGQLLPRLAHEAHPALLSGTR